MTNTLDELTRLKEEYKEKVRAVGVPMIREILDPLFQDSEYVMWYQYTPAFNDGDPCEFTVGWPYTLSDDGGDREDVEVNDAGELRAFDEVPWDDWQSSRKVWESDVVEDVLEVLFGNNVEVVLHRDGTYHVGEYYCGY